MFGGQTSLSLAIAVVLNTSSSGGQSCLPSARGPMCSPSPRDGENPFYILSSLWDLGRLSMRQMEGWLIAGFQTMFSNGSPFWKPTCNQNSNFWDGQKQSQCQVKRIWSNFLWLFAPGRSLQAVPQNMSWKPCSRHSLMALCVSQSISHEPLLTHRRF